jgi:hypothetical protein
MRSRWGRLRPHSIAWTSSRARPERNGQSRISRSPADIVVAAALIVTPTLAVGGCRVCSAGANVIANNGTIASASTATLLGRPARTSANVIGRCNCCVVDWTDRKNYAARVTFRLRQLLKSNRSPQPQASKADAGELPRDRFNARFTFKQAGVPRNPPWIGH